VTASTEHFVALLVSILTAVGLMGAGLVFLIRISVSTGRLVERVDTHIENEDKRAESVDRRLTWLEQQKAGRR
jgi:predicted PurR-regulated permease PerM